MGWGENSLAASSKTFNVVLKDAALVGMKLRPSGETDMNYKSKYVTGMNNLKLSICHQLGCISAAQILKFSIFTTLKQIKKKKDGRASQSVDQEEMRVCKTDP